MRVDVYTHQDVYVGTIGPDELLAFTHTDELNGEDSVSITTSFPLKQGYRLVWADRLSKAHEHICQDPKGLHAQGRTVYTDTALNSVYELAYDYIEDKRPYSYSFLRALQVALEDTRWECGTVDQPGTVSSGLTFYHTSARAALNDILECGGELETAIEVGGEGVTSRKAGIRQHRGESSTHRRFTYTKDLVSVGRTEHYGAITACYGYGKGVETDSGGYGRKLTFGDITGGKNYVEDAAALKAWGRPDGKGGFAHVFGKYENSQCEDSLQLLAETRAYLDEHKEPGVTYEADVVDLVQFGRSWEGVGVGDDVQIVDTEFSPELRCQGRVTKLVTDLLGGTKTVTLGNVTATMADMWAAQQQEVSSLSNRSSNWDVAANTPAAYLQQVIDGLNEQFNTQGMSYCFTSFEQGTIWSSVPLDENGHPTTTGGSAIQICSQGFRIASGTKADGSWDWRTFGTGDGFTADEITAGTLNADLIKAGTIEDGTGRNYWDLKTGEIQISNYATVAQATGEGTELIANNIDGTGSGGWCSYTRAGSRTDGRSQWKWDTEYGYQVVQLCGTADSTTKFRGQYYASDNCTLTAAASDTAAYPRAVDMSCEMCVANATADASGYFRMTLQYKDASGNWGWLAGPTVPISSVMGWTQCSARAVLPANCAIDGIWCFVHVGTAGASVNCLLRQAHAKISPIGTGDANLMAGTAGFSALTGSNWANGGLDAQGSVTLSHAHDSTCPVPESDCVTVAATTTGTKAGFCQPSYADLNDGDALTFSFWAKASRYGCAVQAHCAWINGVGTVGDWTGAVGMAWTRIITHGTVNGTVDRSNNDIGQVVLSNPTAGDKLYVCGLKVERGGVASAWSTAPTDLTNYMRLTSEGLEVGKKVNGSYSGAHSVHKSDGFYIHDASHNDLAHFKSNEVSLLSDAGMMQAGSYNGGHAITQKQFRLCSPATHAIVMQTPASVTVSSMHSSRFELSGGTYNLAELRAGADDDNALLTLYNDPSKHTESLALGVYAPATAGIITLGAETGKTSLRVTATGTNDFLGTVADLAHTLQPTAWTFSENNSSAYMVQYTGWHESSVMTALIGGASNWSEYFTKTVNTLTVKVAGVYRVRGQLCAHNAGNRVGFGVFQGATEKLSAFGEPKNLCTCAYDGVLSLTAGTTLAFKEFCYGNYMTKARDQKTNVTVEYLGHA